MEKRLGDGIMTYSGVEFWPLDPRPEEIKLVDIAHALAMSCRWIGHTHDFYSVAEHSWLASHLVPEEFAVQALLHDASEAYLSDIARPVKLHLANYYEIEEVLQRTIYVKYGCQLEMAPAVKLVDDQLLVREAELLISNHERIHKPAEPAKCVLPLWEPRFARKMFLNRCEALGLNVND